MTSPTPPSDSISLTTTNGELHLQLPRASRFGLDATATRGDIDTDFDFNVTRGARYAETHGTVGSGGPRITLTTTNGSIAVRY